MSTTPIITDSSPVVTLPLAPFDQYMPRLYTRLVLSFPVPPTTTHSSITTLLRYGLKELITDIPYLTGKVCLSPDGETTGRMEIRRQLYDRLDLCIKDLTTPNSGWMGGSYDELMSRHMPPSFLDGDILAPVVLFPDQKTPTGVMAAQANFIPGGLLLCIAIHHSVMDGEGIATVLKTWAKWCRRGPDSGYVYGSEPEFPTAALDRGPLMKGSGEVLARGHREYKILGEEESPKPAAPVALPKVDPRIFYFSADSLARLKAAVTGALPPPREGEGAPKPWVSTNDALSAFLWSCITSARMPRLRGSSMADPDEESVLSMAVDGRRRLDPPLPSEYIGNATLYSTAAALLSDLTPPSLPLIAALALKIRASVSQIDTPHIRSAIALLSAPKDIRNVKAGFKSFLGKDLSMTTWAEQGVMETEWGGVVGGKPTGVRVPRHEFDGFCLVYPRLGDGGLEIWVGLEEGDMGRLREDRVFAGFAVERCG